MTTYIRRRANVRRTTTDIQRTYVRRKNIPRRTATDVVRTTYVPTYTVRHSTYERNYDVRLRTTTYYERT